MLVSLAILRIEVNDDYLVPSSFKYKAPYYKMPVEKEGTKSHITFAAALSIGTKHELSGSEKEIIDKTRGCRADSEISIETYSNEENSKTERDTSKKTSDTSHFKNSKKTHEANVISYGKKLPGGDDDDDDEHSEKSSSQESSKVASNCRDPSCSSGETMHYNSNNFTTRHKNPNSSSIHFFSGNPMVEVTKGILHIYKDNQMVLLKEDLPRSEMICMLGVSASYTIHDLLRFTASVSAGVESMRIIRDSTPNQYMVLVKFKTQELADEFYSAFNNTQFNSIESDICHLVYIAKIETMKSSEGAGLPIPGLTELPNCPVCLERMDESVEGILTILCNHAFHVTCLAQWGYTSCPVCRYCQTPEEVPDNRCLECGSQESLWICLICGHVGCGRYVGRHAYRHFQETQHTYAMQLGNNKVWDYAGDNYVHRLVQNKTDGKLVEVDERGNAVYEKLDALTLEYTYLLTSQLESQRLYFEEKIARVEQDALLQVKAGESRHKQMVDEHNRMEEALERVNRLKNQTEKKCTQYHSQLSKVMRELQEERAMNKSLQENQSVWQEKVAKLETRVKEINETKTQEIQELQEQLRDMMFHLEAQQKLTRQEGLEEISQEEIQGGQEETRAKLAATQEQSQRYYNKHAQYLPEMLGGQHVHTQDPITKTWIPAQIDMWLRYFAILFSILINAECSNVCSSVQTSAMASRCLDQQLGNIGSQLQIGSIVAASIQQYHYVCGNLPEFVSCLQTIYTGSCQMTNATAQTNIQQQTQFLSWVCNKAFGLLMAVIPCLSNPSTKQSLQDCGSGVSNNCSTLNNMVLCRMNVANKCSYDAMQFTRSYWEITLRLKRNILNCPPPTYGMSTMSPTGILCSAVSNFRFMVTSNLRDA
ncbi:BRCA1-associated protein-like [Octopus vulgaris]|uniref:BRCA1-associated protein-like n=1 Tax=Octopus vulgaris TaxID=6645 RepID=A0AA36AHT5_OCTVU|nr:BRCA1-associated protein-like [Octopus vulgaris]